MARITLHKELFDYDKELRKDYPVIVGIDEAGRGPLAGDVYAAAVILNDETLINYLNDIHGLEIGEIIGDYIRPYLAAITNIDPNQYEAATIDGANRFQKMTYITLPNMRMIIVLMMVLSLGNVLNAGFDQVYNLYSKQVYSTGDILDTFIYRIGLLDAQFGVATAMGMFKSVVSTLFISTSYFCAYKFADYRIF